MSLIPVNLARRPFRNERPVTRLAIALWVAGALLAGLNVWLYWTYYAGSGEIAERMVEISEETTAERQRIRQREQQLAGLDLGQQNEVAEYLNLKIAERTFGWSRLFDHLAEVLPDDVRLLSLTPNSGGQDRRRDARSEDEPDTVLLGIRGEAKNDEALLSLIDGLFDHPAFARPNLSREARQQGTQFLLIDLSVEYLPQAGPRADAEEDGEEAGADAGRTEGEEGEAEDGDDGDLEVVAMDADDAAATEVGEP